MRTIGLGLIGFGTVGTGVVKLLQDNRDVLEARLGARLVLKKIADLDIVSPRPVAIETGLLTQRVEDLIADSDIDIVIELMGGFEPARTLILNALSRGKHVVTANKALLATHGNEIFCEAESRGVNIGFEASVGGTIPVVKTLREALGANHIRSIFAIMNGTSNFILSKMTDEGESFDTVLRQAQALGHAEADPTYDVEGIDTAHKLAIVLSLAYGRRVRLEDIYREGISHLTPQDIDLARELGYRIKLLAIAVEREGGIEARIHPTMIPFSHLLASVNSNFNAFHIIGDAADSVFLYGQGSGMMPTASAVVGDLMDIARDILKGISCRVPSRALHEASMPDIAILPMAELKTNYYFRFSAVDRPGVLSKISGILGQKDISIAAVIQKGRKRDGAVPVVMTTYKAREADVQAALREIDRLDVVMGKTQLCRIEDESL
jgi:homoserine dehydrogenase